MIYIRYILMVPVSLALTLIALITAPLMVLLQEQRDGELLNGSTWNEGPRLPTWLDWFMTPDNSLDGDETFQIINGIGYWSQVRWLWRNPAYGYGLAQINNPYYTKVRGDKTIKDNDNAKEGWCVVNANGLFQLVYIKRIVFTSRCVYINVGWNIRALVDDNFNPKPLAWRATFVFSPRISGFR